MRVFDPFLSDINFFMLFLTFFLLFLHQPHDEYREASVWFYQFIVTSLFTFCLTAA